MTQDAKTSDAEVDRLSTVAALFFVGSSFLEPCLEKREFERVFEPLGRNEQGYEEVRHRETAVPGDREAGFRPVWSKKQDSTTENET